MSFDQGTSNCFVKGANVLFPACILFAVQAAAVVKKTIFEYVLSVRSGLALPVNASFYLL